MFTHPTLQLLARTKFFGEGHRFSGLDPKRLGAVPLYRGAGRIRTPADKPARWPRSAPRTPAPRLRPNAG